jgi:hypothetical protein
MRTIQITDEIEETPSGRDAYVDRLTRGAGGATEPAPAEDKPLDADGLPISGYDSYCFGLTHRKPKTASDGKAGR